MESNGTDACCSNWLYITLLISVATAALFYMKSPLQYTVKMIMFFATCFLLATILFPVGLFLPFRAENHRLLAFVVPLISFYIFNFSVEVRGRENAKINQPFVLLLNHQSSLDAFIMLHIWPDKCVTVMKRELVWLFPFGTTSWLFGCIFIDRSNRENSQAAIKKAADDLVRREVKICMFPEGTRHREVGLLPFKKGAFNLAVNAQVPIVPAVITDLSNFYSKKKNIFTPGRCILTVLPPVETSGLAAADVPQLAESTRDAMVEVYERTNAELQHSITEQSTAEKSHSKSE